MLKGKSKIIQSLWEDEDDAKAPPPNPVDVDYKALYETERIRTTELEDIIAKLENKIESLKQELLLYKSAGGQDESQSEDDVAIESTLIRESVSHKSEPVSQEWQLLAEQEKERRQRARARNTQGRGAVKRVAQLTTTAARPKSTSSLPSNIPGVDGSTIASNGVSSSTSTMIPTVTKGALHPSSRIEPSNSHTIDYLEEAVGEPLPLSAQPLTPKYTLNWNSSDEDDDSFLKGPSKANEAVKEAIPVISPSSNIEATLESTSRVAAPATAAAAASQAPPTADQLEWERLAQEERDRKQKARQRLQQGHRAAKGAAAVAPRTRLTAAVSRAGVLPTGAGATEAAAAPAVSTNSQTEGNGVLPKVNTRRKSRGMSEDSRDSGWDDSGDEQVPATRPSRDDSFFDSDSSEDEEPSSAKAETAPLKLSTSSSSLSNESTSAAALEAAIDQEVLRWAAGKNISTLIQTMGQIFSESVPNLGPQWALGLLPPQDPASVRRAFLLTVRCCHPDKQSASNSERSQMIAAKVFAALSDSYGHYKTMHNI